MKVLTVYYKHKPGGFCKRLRMSIEAWLERGWQVHYIAAEPYPYSHPNLFPHILPNPARRHDTLWFWGWFFLACPWYALFTAIKYRPALIAAPSPVYACICAPARWILRKPMLTFIFSKPRFNTDCREEYRFLEKVERSLEKRGLGASSRILANSQAGRSAWVTEYGPSAERIEVFPNNVDDPPFDKEARREKLRDEFSLGPERFVIACSGIMEPHKNMDLSIEAFAKVKDPRAILMLIGDGTRIDFLKRRARELGVADRTIFTGWRRDAVELVQGADLYVFPSLREGMSDALLEALTCRVPCLVSSIPENREVARNPEQHFPPKDAQGLAEKITRCMEDRDFYDRLLRATLEDKARFTFDWKARLIAVAEETMKLRAGR